MFGFNVLSIKSKIKNVKHEIKDVNLQGAIPEF
jgi:hypothetical protein